MINRMTKVINMLLSLCFYFTRYNVLILEKCLQFCHQKFSINVDKGCFPSLHGADLEQKTHIILSYPYIVKSLEYKDLLPHNEGDPCHLNSFMISCTCKRM